MPNQSSTNKALDLKGSYEILKLPFGATLAQLNKSFRKLALLHHTDKVAGYGVFFKELVNARDMIRKELQAKTKSKLEPEKKKSEEKIKPWREREPENEEELRKWLEEDSEKDNFKLADDFPEAASSNIYSNMWKLMQAERLTYASLQFMSSIERKHLTKIMLWDNQLTEQIIRGISKDSSESYTVLDLLHPAPSRFHEVFDQLKRVSPSEKHLRPEEELFLRVLMEDWKYSKPISEKFKVTPSNNLFSYDVNRKLLESLEELGAWGEVSCSVADLIRGYWNERKFTLEQLQPELQYRLQATLNGGLNGFEELNNLSAILKSTFQAWGTKGGVTEIRKEKLEELQEGIKALALTKVKDRLYNHSSFNLQPEELKSRQHDLLKNSGSRRIVLYREVSNMIDSMIATQAVHRDPVRAAIKLVACWVFAIVTLGVAALADSRIREGCRYRTATKSMLLKQKQHLKNLCRIEESRIAAASPSPAQAA